MTRDVAVAFWLGSHAAQPPRYLTAPRYMTVAQCATFINRSPKAVRGLVERQEIPCIRVGRRVQFDQRKVEGWMLRNADRRRPIR